MNIKRLFAPVSRLYRLKRVTMQICMIELIKKTMRQNRLKAFLMQMIMTKTTTTSACTKCTYLKYIVLKMLFRLFRLAGGNCYININYSGTIIRITVVL